MRILLDTNIVIDVLTQRQPHFEKSAEVMELCKRGLVQGVVCSLSYTTIAYIIGKKMTVDEMYQSLNSLLETCNISLVNADVIGKAINAHRKDFEDTVQYYSALTSNVDCIVTRDKTGFNDLSIPVFTPEEFMDNCR